MSQADLFAFLDQPAAKPARKPAIRKPMAEPPKLLTPLASMAPAKSLETKTKATKKLSAASESALTGVYTRNLADWLQREDDFLLDSVLTDPNEGAKKSKSKTSHHVLRLDDFAIKFSRDPVLVLRRIIDSDIPAMAGIEMDAGSEEACEFMGLALAGVPLSLALRWCAATEEQLDRPQWADIQASMTGADRRGAMRLVVATGMWFTSSSQLWSLDMLCDQDEGDVREAAFGVIERVDAPTPDVVSQQMFGAFEGEACINWSGMAKPKGGCFMSDLFAEPSGAGGRSGTRGRARSRAHSAASASSSSVPGSAEYSANPGNWGGKKKRYYGKRRAWSSSRTIKSGTSYVSVNGKAKKKGTA